MRYWKWVKSFGYETLKVRDHLEDWYTDGNNMKLALRK
jgi:hypothetical protein